MYNGFPDSVSILIVRRNLSSVSYSRLYADGSILTTLMKLRKNLQKVLSGCLNVGIVMSSGSSLLGLQSISASLSNSEPEVSYQHKQMF